MPNLLCPRAPNRLALLQVTLLGLALALGPLDAATQEVPLPDTARPMSQELEAAQEAVRELLAIYRRIEGLREVRIRMEGAVLELSGSALSAEDRDRAGELAATVPGVRWVDNRIEVERSLRKRLAPVAERLRQKGVAFIQFLPLLLVGFTLLGLTVVIAILAGRPRFPYDRLTSNAFGANMLRQAVRGVIVLTGVLLTLELLGATALVGAVLGTAGVAGLAVGFAFRDIVENYLAGVILSLRQPFAPNDLIQLAGHEGRVVRLTGRDTILMTLDGNHVRIPNATVFKGIMVNLTRNPRRRFLVQLGIGPGEDVERALAEGKAALARLAGVLPHPPVGGRVHELGSSSVELRFTGWVNQTEADFGKVRSEAVRTLRDAMAAAAIATPAPEYGVRILREPEVPGPVSPKEGAPVPGPAPGEPDVEPDLHLEEQIAEDRATSPEEDLLSPAPSSDSDGSARKGRSPPRQG